MNGNFRKPEFVKRYEYTYYDLETPLNAIVANNARQTKDNYRFVVDNSSEANPIDWYNAYLEVDFQLVTLADSTVGIVGGNIDNENKICTTTNGHTFIKEIQVECNGISVYTNMKANESSNALTLLKYTKSYADSIGKDQFFYVDGPTGLAEARSTEDDYNEGFAKRKKLTDAAAVNKISIPLNLYSYFAAFKNQLHPNIKTNILIKLENDNNIIFRKGAAPDSKVIVTKMRLWCPKIIFNGLGMKEYTEKYLKPKKWTYLKEHHEIIQTTAVNSYFRISTGIRRPRHVLVWVVNNVKYNSQQGNIFSFNTFAVGTANRYFTKYERDDDVNPALLWEMIKLKIREQTLKYAKNKKAKTLKMEDELEKRINLLQNMIDYNGTGEQEKLDATKEQELKKAELERIIEYRTNGAILRAKCRWHNEGEKNTKYFLNLEKRHYKNGVINQLKTGENEFVTSDKEILSECETFYKNLYSSHLDASRNDFQNDNFFSVDTNTKVLDDRERQTCEGFITKQECLQALKDMEPNKTPGSDGLPAEFYKIFWNEISDYLINSINHAFGNGQLSVTQRRGIIKLIPKKDTETNLIKNWRPITLLNCDYKIAAKAIANRIKNVLPNMINNDQTGFIKGRFIGENIRLIDGVIQFAAAKNISGLLLFLDFEKAFDTVEWTFIQRTFKHFNFGPSIIN